jgi:16S rRNA C967 or C1407 C5-methylase (RsmB/RsmF family)
MEQVPRLLLKLSQRLFADSQEQDAFVHSLLHPAAPNPCILWCQEKRQDSPFELEPPLPWQPEFVDRLVGGQKPGQHPLHQQGAFYCLDFSSVFAIAPLVLLQSMQPSPVEVILDVCASPGGKSIFAWVALQPRLLISNEVIGKRMAALISNLKRCHIAPAIATNLDSKILAQQVARTAQVVLVDAPCSGQSLLAKGDKAPGCFHPVTINSNANRQKRILANSAQLVAPGGYLIYMTCTYSPEENEQVAAWFAQRFPQFQAIAVPQLAAYQSHLADFPCYRMFPQANPGAGAFTVLLQNREAGEQQVVPEAFLTRGVQFR